MLFFYIKTLGCSMNYSDSERIAAMFLQMGMKKASEINQADFVVFNTCSIKQKAEDKVFSQINNISKIKTKNIKILLTGCMVKKTSTHNSAKKDPLLNKISQIDAVFRIEDLIHLEKIIKNLSKKTKLDKFQSQYEYLKIKPQYTSKFQAIIPIQTGCDNFCTYCVVPYTRGREWSRPINDILAEVQSLVASGVKEVNLVGQNVNSYGKNMQNFVQNWNKEKSQWKKEQKETPFTTLLKEVNNIAGIERIRFQSSNPHDMTDDIIEAICSLDKVMPSIHIALQSGDDRLLQLMNRKHSYVDFLNIIKKIRAKRPDFSISTDIIVGFCEETESAFQKTLKAVQEIDVDMIYISQYSPRQGTIAYDKLQDTVSPVVKKKRWHLLNSWLKNHITAKMKNLLKTEQKVLIEKVEKNYAIGKTEYNHHCQVESKELKEGDIVKVRVIDYSTWAIRGEIL